MPLLQSLPPMKHGIVIATSSYAVKFMERFAASPEGKFPSVFASSHFLGFGQDQPKVGDMKVAFFSGKDTDIQYAIDDAVIFALLQNFDNTVSKGLLLLEMELTDKERKAPQHMEFPLPIDSVRRLNGTLNPPKAADSSTHAKTLASRVTSKCILAIEPADTIKLKTVSAYQWGLKSGLSSILAPATSHGVIHTPFSPK